MKAVAITGASGFLGGALMGHLSARGIPVVAIVHRERSVARVRSGCVRVAVVPLGESPPDEALEGVGAIVHAAHDFRPGSLERNVAGTRLLVQAAVRRGVRQQVFLSSQSAHARAATEYGRTKVLLEKVFLEIGGVIVRPGLVVGAGGLFGRILSFLRHAPVVPLPNGGSQKVSVLGLRDFLLAGERLIEGPVSGVLDLFHPTSPTLREVIECCLGLLRRHPPVLSIPSGPVLAFLDLLEASRIPLPFRSENLRGLLESQPVSRETNLLELVQNPLGLEEMVRDALASSHS